MASLERQLMAPMSATVTPKDGGRQLGKREEDGKKAEEGGENGAAKALVDLWSEIIRSEEEDGDGFREVPQVEREGSIAVGAYVNNQPQKKPVRRKKPVMSFLQSVESGVI
ncbi:hypothetical protein Bca52824_048388 [Brassica carinata]|uniref:Uncharacterized protein n=1 Tax=Brassica carinata TaxID=52824 RepID=A0A8X7RGJ7_BRACI|nr:hypothetical protein Bca52824_048388 [Brassica carinata]